MVYICGGRLEEGGEKKGALACVCVVGRSDETRCEQSSIYMKAGAKMQADSEGRMRRG